MPRRSIPGELAAALAPIVAKEATDVAALAAAIAAQLDTYRYGKALNAAFPAMVPSAVDVLIVFVQANNTPGSAAIRAATANIPAPPGGDYETLVLAPWLATLTSPPTLAQLRTATLALTY